MFGKARTVQIPFIVGLVVAGLASAGVPADAQLARMVKDINAVASAASSFPSNFVELEGAVYFTADDGANRTELWRSDGTASGTHIVIDIYPGAASSPGPLAVVGRTL